MFTNRLLFSIDFVLLNLLFLHLGLSLNFLDSALRAGSLVFGVIVVLLGSLGGGTSSSINLIILSLADNLAGCLVNNLHLLLGDLGSPVVFNLVDTLLIDELLLLVTEALFLSLREWISIFKA